MAIVDVAGDVAVEGRKRRGDYGHGHATKKRLGVVLAVTMASGTFQQAGWPDGENWKTGCLSDLSDRGCSSSVGRGVPGRKAKAAQSAKPRGLLWRL